MMRKSFILGAFILSLIGGTAAAHAHVVRYMSKHPLPRKVGHGFCYIDVPHFHDYPPSDPRLYRQVGDQYYFVGDPSPFEYDGQRYAYYGAHPVVDASVQLGAPTYCYLKGPHYHWYAPPAQASFELKGGAYWYVGNYDPVYYQEQPRYAVVNEAYAPIAYPRPVVDVTIAPPAFHGEIVAAGPGWRGQAVVGAPVVSAGVTIGVPAPPPVAVGVGINLGGPPTVIEQREVIVREHDHGRHEGWYKKHGHEEWRGGPPPAGGSWRGGPGPAPGGSWRGPAPAAAPAGGWRGGPAPAPAPHGGSWRGGPAPGPAPAAGGGWRGGGAPAHKNNGGWKR
jgi:hypothetical protein